MQEAEKQIELLTRKIAREQKARQSAEVKLEEYSREIYIANESLKANLIKTNERQADLEFLHRTASAVNSALSIPDLLNEIIKLVGLFVDADMAAWEQCDEHGQVIVEKSLVRGDDAQWRTDESEVPFLRKKSHLSTFNDSESWIVTPLDGNEVLPQSFGTALYLNLPYTSSSSYIIGFICRSEIIQPEFLFVLDTAKDHLLSGIRRRATEVRIQRRNQQLEKAVQDLEFAQTQLIQSEKMASLGQLAAGVAHEINNPIGYIRSNLEVLGDYHQTFKTCFDLVNDKLQAGDADTKMLLKIVSDFDLGFLLKDSRTILTTNLKGIDRVKEIVAGLKTFSHAGENKQVLMSLNQCIENALKMVANEFKYQHVVSKELSSESSDIIGNEAQLQQVFVNFFINAAAAMPEGGELKVCSHETEERIEIRVSDTGHGMTEDTKNKIFTPFFTTKPVGSGTGLGLSISMAILEAHNVSVHVDSEVNVGTTFNLVFPKATSSQYS